MAGCRLPKKKILKGKVMKLKIKKQVVQETETEIDLPAFFTLYGCFIMLKEDGMIVKAQPSFACSYGKNSSGYDRDMAEILSEGKPSTSADFYGCFSTCMQHLAQEAGYDINLYLIPEPENA
jgi:hypothetical protein